MLGLSRIELAARLEVARKLTILGGIRDHAHFCRPTPKTPSPVKKPPNSVDGVGDVIDDTAVIGEHEVTCPESIASLGKTGSGMSLTSEIPEVETISED